MPVPDLAVIAIGGGWHRVLCSSHGPLPMIWTSALHASWDALGHAAHHHR